METKKKKDHNYIVRIRTIKLDKPTNILIMTIFLEKSYLIFVGIVAKRLSEKT